MYSVIRFFIVSNGRFFKELEGSQCINWSEALLNHFENAQAALKEPKTLIIPQRTGQLILAVDASPLNKG